MNVAKFAKRGLFLASLLSIGAGAAFAQSAIPLPYEEDFDDWTEGPVAEQLAGKGWSAGADDASTIAIDAVQGNVLNLNTEGATLQANFDNADFQDDPLYVDAMVKFVVSEDDPASIPDDVKIAFWLNASSNLVVYHGAVSGSTIIPATTVLENIELDPANFYRLTVETDFDGDSIAAYKVSLNGEAIESEEAYTDEWRDELGGTVPGGNWFLAKNTDDPHSINALAFQGTGMVDDIYVGDVNPIISNWTLTLGDTENGGFTTNGAPAAAGEYAFEIGTEVVVAAVPAVGYKVATFTADGVAVVGQWVSTDVDATLAATFEAYKVMIGNEGYDTLADAVAAAKAGDTIVLADNVEVDSWILINKEVTLDLAGNTISPSDNWDASCDAIIAINRGGKLTIVDSSDPSTGCIDSETVMVGVKMTATKALDYIDPATYGDDNKAEFILNNGTIKGFNYGISGNGNAGRGNTAVTINGGKVIATGNGDTEGCVGIYNPQFGTLTINGGYIEGDEGVVVKAGSVTCTVNAGTIVGVGANNEYVGGNNGADPTGAGFAIDNAGYPGGTPSASIVGGTFVSSNGVAVASYNRASTTAIEGFVSGGTFNTEVPAALCATGFIPVANDDGTFGVKEGAYVAQIDDVKFESLADAYEAAEAGAVITLLSDCEGNGISIAKSITIDFDGNTYTVIGNPAGSTGTKSQAFQVLQSAGAVTFKDGTITSTEVVKMLVNNYTDLTLDNMVLDGTNMGVAHKAGTEQVVPNYTLSNNNGTSTLTGGTQVISKGSGHFAMDTYDSAGYPGIPSVVVNGATIDGDVELTGGNLDLESGTLNGVLVATAVGGGTITKAEGFTAAAPAGYKWDNGVLIEDVGPSYTDSSVATADDGTTEIAILGPLDGEGAPLSFGAVTISGTNITVPFTAAIDGTGTVSSGLYLKVKYDLLSDVVDTIPGVFNVNGDEDTGSVTFAMPTGKAMVFAIGITDTPANQE